MDNSKMKLSMDHLEMVNGGIVPIIPDDSDDNHDSDNNSGGGATGGW